MTSDLHHLAAAYALDALDDVERRAFEDHYPSCETCAVEVDEFREVAAELAGSEAMAPPPQLRASVMHDIAQTRQLSPLTGPGNRTPSRSRQVLLAAAAALLVLGGVLVATLPGTGSDTTDEVVAAADAVVTPLDPLTGLDGNLQVVWSDELDRVVVVGSGLEDLDAERAYALWFILDDGGVAPAALFRTDDGSVSEVLTVDDIDAAGWGITIEPAQGSPQPTTDVIYAGTL